MARVVLSFVPVIKDSLRLSWSIRTMSVHRVLAESILREQRRPLSAREIVESARASGRLRDGFGGQSPARSMDARLSESIRNAGSEGTFVRHSPGRFFLRELLADPDLPAAFRRTYSPAQRAKQKEPRLVMAARSFLEIDGLIPPREVLALVDTDNMQFRDPTEALPPDVLAVWAFVIVTGGGRLLTFRKSSKRGTRRKALGFSAPVTRDDPTLFDRDSLGIVERGLRTIRVSLGPTSFTVEGHGTAVAKLDGFIVSRTGGRPILLAIIRFETGDHTAPFSRRHGITDLRLEDTANVSNGMHLLDPQAEEVFRALTGAGLADFDSLETFGSPKS
ncbi:MAG: hypothetical protein EOO76_02850 [Novosphingobium sp.]|nr:MAG: hypothetical protein EOO76_02850 [Novosphingobium sp.]